MRIGTWNLAGRWTAAHLELMVAADVDVWLLTEVSERLELPGYALHPSAELVSARRRWAAVAARAQLAPLPDPHPASAAALVGATTFVATVLPWQGCVGPLWPGSRHVERTEAAIECLLVSMPAHGVVWGGDWNHALTGPEVTGSKGGRTHLTAALNQLGLVTPTTDLGRTSGVASIDHIAVHRDVQVHGAHRIDHGGLSDHDAYVVDVESLA